MMHATSTFFAGFSLGAIIAVQALQPASRPGGGIGGMAGGTGVGDPVPRNYCKSESCSYPIDLTGDKKFDEAEFFSNLKEIVEKQITGSGSAISFLGEIDGDFNSSEVFFEYVQGSIKGRVILSGKVIGGLYLLRAVLEEQA